LSRTHANPDLFLGEGAGFFAYFAYFAVKEIAWARIWGHSGGLTFMDDNILKLLGRHDYAPSNVPELLRRLGLRPNEQQSLVETLRRLERSGRIVRTKGNRFILAQPADLIPGVIRINRQGRGFLQPDDRTVREIVVEANATSTALHGDRVLVRRDVRPGARRAADEPVTGAVVRVLERKRSRIVGTLQESKQFLFVIPDDPRIPHDIYVSPPRDAGRPARAGDKVVVELRQWESRHANPEGEIIEVLGPADEEGVDMLSVLRQYNLPLHFPKGALREAEQIARSRRPGEIAGADMAGRVDCRAHPVVTIDPDDAKDFDDAICLERAGDGRWKVWVHIADVSHYVKPGCALDEEARRRGNSTYLVDRVIPMLPEALSNELCSLKPGTDRLTKCVELLVTGDGRVLGARFYPAVIRSARRLTYKEALAVIQSAPRGGAIERMLQQAHELAQEIRRARFKAGSLDLDFPDTKIRLDEHGRLLRVERMENDVSHQLIEEYMLLANEAVAGRLMALRRPAVYRVHEPPEERRLQEYRRELAGHQIPCGNLSQRGEAQKLMRRLSAMPAGQALKIGFLKSLTRARYATEPLGHYGLGKAKYTHFTSPIRRYADLLVHRALFDSAGPGIPALKEIARHISETERNSADAERDSKDVKLFAFLKAQIKSGRREKYAALVTDARNFGFFVDVEGLGMGGLVPLSSILDDFYVFDAARGHLIGRRTRRIIKAGDRITVQVYKVNFFKKQVDFQLVTAGPARPGATAASGGRHAGRAGGSTLQPVRAGGSTLQPVRAGGSTLQPVRAGGSTLQGGNFRRGERRGATGARQNSLPPR
jgi:ribonuclease R